MQVPPAFQFQHWMCGRVGEWVDVWMDGWTGGPMGGLIDAWVDVCMDGWTAGWTQMDGRVDEHVDRWMCGCIDGCTGPWMDRWMDGWMVKWVDHEWVDGCMDAWAVGTGWWCIAWGVDVGRRSPKRQGSPAEGGAQPLVDHDRGGSLVQEAFSWACCSKVVVSPSWASLAVAR